MRSAGPILVLVGVGIAVLGLLLWGGLLNWFGRLPGDIRVERPGGRFYVPLTSMIIVSVVLSLALALFRRWRP